MGRGPRIWAALALGLYLAACGSRSTLFDSTHSSTEPRPTPRTSEPEPEPEPEPDPEPEPEPGCEADECPDDGDACNGRELCDPDTRRCVHVEPLACDDGLSCNGIETCDPDLGCVTGEPIECAAPGAYCDENTGACACDAPFLGPDCTIKTALFAYFGQVRDLAEERGALWVTTDNGLWVLDFADTPGDPTDDHWSRFDQLRGNPATGSILIDPAGTKWFASEYDRPLARLEDAATPLTQDDDTWYFYGPTDGFTARALGFDGMGKIWLGQTGNTLAFSDSGTPEARADDTWRPVNEFNAEPFELTNIDVILSEPPGMLWLGSSRGGLYGYNTQEAEFVDQTHSSWSRVHHLAYEAGVLWASVQSTNSETTQIAGVPMHGPIVSAVPEDQWQFSSAPHAIDMFDVDAGSRVWASHPSSGLSCWQADADATWSEWSINETIRSVRTRSPVDLWFGADSVFYLEHGGACEPQPDAVQELIVEQNLRSPARDIELDGDGVWIATDRGVDYLDTRGTPFDPKDDRWVHFDASEAPGLEGLQGVLLGPAGIKYFWGEDRVFLLDDGGTPFDKSDDAWVAHDAGQPLWVSGVVDADGVLLVIARTGFAEQEETPEVVVFDPGGTPRDASDDRVATIASGLPGFGRTMAIDIAGEVWVGTEGEQLQGNLYHWNRGGTPVDAQDDVWTPVRPQPGRVWKLVADPTGGLWGTVGTPEAGVFHFFDGGSPTELSDDYWHIYTNLGSAMEIRPDGNGWFRMPGGAGILNVGGTPRDASDDVARTLLSPEALRFASDLWTNGSVDDAGRFWVVDENVQVFEVVE